MTRERGLSGEEQRLADLLKRTVPEPPRQLTYEEITVQYVPRRSWLVPTMAAAAVLVIGGAVGAVAATRSGPPATVFRPSASQSTPAPVAKPAPTCTPVPVPGIRIPFVVGVQESNALAILQAQGLEVRVVMVRRSAAPRGTVVRQAPAGGTVVPRGATVTVDVSASGGSSAPRPVPSPTSSVCATPVAAPTPTASASVGGPLPVPSATPTAIPSPTSTAAPSATQTAATAPPTAAAVPMPKVVGQTQAQAVATLQAIGVRAVIVHKSAGHSVRAGLVWRQYPPTGSTVASGMTVTLDVQP